MYAGEEYGLQEVIREYRYGGRLGHGRKNERHELRKVMSG